MDNGYRAVYAEQISLTELIYYLHRCDSVAYMIERNLEAGKREFLIFPYGANGMLFEDVLHRRYGIRPKAVFDNNLSKYNPEVRKLEEIEGYLGDGACIVLTTLIPECRKALERYCDIRTAESPFSII